MRWHRIEMAALSGEKDFPRLGFGILAFSILMVSSLHSPPFAATTQNRCEEYARTAIAQQEENLRLGCGLSGPMWNADYQYHYGWCSQGANVQQADGGTNQRAAALDQCRNRAKAPGQLREMQRLPLPELMNVEPVTQDRPGTLPLSLPGTREELITEAISNPAVVAAFRAVPALRDAPFQQLGRVTLAGKRLPMKPIEKPVLLPGDSRLLSQDWESGVQFTPNENGRTMYIGNTFLHFGLTLRDLAERDELPVSSAMGFRLVQEISPAPPMGNYLITIHLHELDRQQSPHSRMSEFKFELLITDRVNTLAAQWGTTTPLTVLTGADGVVNGLVAVASINRPLTTLALTVERSQKAEAAPGDQSLLWQALFRGLTIMLL